jgi:hypothetical protein
MIFGPSAPQQDRWDVWKASGELTALADQKEATASLGFDSCLFLLQASVHIVGFGTLLPSADRLTNWSRDQYVDCFQTKNSFLFGEANQNASCIPNYISHTFFVLLLSCLTKGPHQNLLELADPLLNWYFFLKKTGIEC